MIFPTDSDTYRVQSIFALLQLGVVIGGSLLVGTVLKLMGYVEGQPISAQLHFVRNWGFLLASIPLAWVTATVYLEKTNYAFSRRHTIASGSVLLVILFIFMFVSAGRAGSTLISIGDGPL